MAQPSLSEDRYALESQIRECFGRVAYSHKTHERKADHAKTRLGRFKWANIVLSALITGGAAGVVFSKDQPFYGYITAVLSIGSLIFNSYLKEVDPGKLAQIHTETAADLWNVRESYLSLLTDIIDERFPITGLRQRRDGLQAALFKIYRTAPRTDGKAYAEAQDRLKNKEDLTFSEKEIDDMLPQTLRRSERDILPTPRES